MKNNPCLRILAVLFILLTQIIGPVAWLHADESTDDETFTTLTRRRTRVNDLPSNISVLTAEDIKNSGAKSLDEVLDHATNIDVSHTGSMGSFANVRMRGTPSSSQVQIIIDDQPFGGFAADQLVDLSIIPVDNIERIEFVRGGSSVLYGANTTGGVIHIITKQQTKQGQSVSFGAERRSFNTDIYRENAGVHSDHADALGTISHFTTDGFQENSDAKETAGSANIGTSWENGSRLSFQAAGVDHEGGVPQGTTVPFSEWDGKKERRAANPTKRAENKRTEGRLRYETPMGNNNLQILAFGSRSWFSSHSSSGLFDPNYSRTAHVYGSDVRFLAQGGFTGGVSYERDEMVDSSNFMPYQTSWGIYLEQQLKSERWSVIPAIRFDRNDNYGSQYNPRLSIVYKATPIWNISANAARSFRAPSFFDTFFDLPPTYFANRNLKPESAWTYDFGNSLTFNKNHRMKLTGFYTKIKDRIVGIDVNNDFMNDTNANVSKSESMGAEFEFADRMGFLSQNGNYSFIRSRGTSATSSEFTDFALTPHHLINYQLDAQLPWSMVLSNNVKYVDRQYQSAGNKGVVLPSYGLWNTRLSKAFKGNEIYVGVNNILNRHYTESYDFEPNLFTITLNPQPDRTYMAGVKITFLGE